MPVSQIKYGKNRGRPGRNPRIKGCPPTRTNGPCQTWEGKAQQRGESRGGQGKKVLRGSSDRRIERGSGFHSPDEDKERKASREKQQRGERREKKKDNS